MTPTEFCQWLNGALDFISEEQISPTQFKVIQAKLKAVRYHAEVQAGPPSWLESEHGQARC
jgi:hypothetical protein